MRPTASRSRSSSTSSITVSSSRRTGAPPSRSSSWTASPWPSSTSALHATLARLGIDVEIRELPFGVPMKTPFPDDGEHSPTTATPSSASGASSTGRTACSRSSPAGSAARPARSTSSGTGLDLAVTRFGGKRAAGPPSADPVTREGYSHELISFGFWAGDENVREPTFYSYTAPEPAGLPSQALRPEDAFWTELGSSHQARLPYDAVRTAADPRAALLEFLESAYTGRRKLSGWDVAGLTSSWHPGRT